MGQALARAAQRTGPGGVARQLGERPTAMVTTEEAILERERAALAEKMHELPPPSTPERDAEIGSDVSETFAIESHSMEQERQEGAEQLSYVSQGPIYIPKRAAERLDALTTTALEEEDMARMFRTALDFPAMSAGQLAERFGVDREVVDQLLQHYSLPTLQEDSSANRDAVWPDGRHEAYEDEVFQKVKLAVARKQNLLESSSSPGRR
mmetsp:Transcript_3844/g.12180  ORF Transcript_3844/g.12180 Transcript_3844/m.12180 type:complete len:209 (+) Transcript_3844:16-642(+)